LTLRSSSSWTSSLMTSSMLLTLPQDAAVVCGRCRTPSRMPWRSEPLAVRPPTPCADEKLAWNAEPENEPEPGPSHLPALRPGTHAASPRFTRATLGSRQPRAPRALRESTIELVVSVGSNSGTSRSSLTSGAANSLASALQTSFSPRTRRGEAGPRDLQGHLRWLQIDVELREPVPQGGG
jgi:hypothetical protein